MSSAGGNCAYAVMSAAAAKGSATPDDAESKKEIYTYEAPWPIYGMAWSMRDEPKYAFR